MTLTRSPWLVPLACALLLALPRCAEDAGPKRSAPEPDDHALVPAGDLGAADAYGPYQGKLAVDTPVGGRLDGYSWYHLWDLDLTGDSRIRFEARGDRGADTYLIMYRWQGNRWHRIATNDDCTRGTLDACLELQLRAGRYLALVSTYEGMVWGRAPEANYTFSASCRGGACDELLCGVPGRRDVPTDFTSADPSWGFFVPFEPVLRTFGGAEADTRTVEEGDIYRVLDPGTILNLNSYRGLQVIDVSDPTAPAVLGRAPFTGSPVEMYAVDGLAWVLLNHWNGYYAFDGALGAEHYEGGVLLGIDVRDPRAPVVVAREQVPGFIRTSRLVRDSRSAALYIAADRTELVDSGDGHLTWDTLTVVSSFALSGSRVQAVDRLDLGGSIADIQATPEALLVARNRWSAGERHSRVAVVDISDPRGAMVAGSEVPVAGAVGNKTNMDLRGGVLRVVSGSTWSGTQTNHVQTFDVTDPRRPRALDHCEFGEGQNLFATLFMEDRAFFVTYLQVDPFHAFALEADGRCREVSEFEVSGWNNFFRPVLGGNRLIGIGIDDANGQTLAVSLYDVTDLANPNPLVARASVAADHSWSEAVWDDRGFTVLDGVVATQAGDALETGMVLLPFSGWSEERHEYVSAVQLFTFSESTLTRRGLMVQGTPVRRTFLTDPQTVANLGEVELTLFDHSDPDAPLELGSLELAPDMAEVLVFGDYAVRLNRSTSLYGWWGDRAELPPSRAEVVPMARHLDTAAPVAELQVPANANLYRVGRLLVSVDRHMRSDDLGEPSWQTDIEIFDLTDPTEPKWAGALSTDRLRPAHWWGGPLIRCFRAPCLPPSGFRGDDVRVVGDTLVFVERVSAEAPIGRDEWRYWQQGVLHVLDLSAPSAPVLRDPLALPAEAELVNTLVDGSRLLAAVRVPASSPDPERRLVRHFVHALDLTDPARPVLGAGVNVPGELLAVDGPNVYTRDTRWSRDRTQTWVARSLSCNGSAWLQAERSFADYDVQRVVLDGAGHLLVSHRLNWDVMSERGLTNVPQELGVFGLERLAELGRLELRDWADLREAASGRALFSVPGGLLVVATADGSAPRAQAFFAVAGWPETLHLLGNRLLLAAGRYGLYDFDLTASNLL
jgi:hypothetical protein